MELDPLRLRAVVMKALEPYKGLRLLPDDAPQPDCLVVRPAQVEAAVKAALLEAFPAMAAHVEPMYDAARRELSLHTSRVVFLDRATRKVDITLTVSNKER